MLVLWFMCVISSTIFTLSEVQMFETDQQCFDNCSCCKEGKCGHAVYDWKNVCLKGCIDGHSGLRCYNLCQYTNCKSCGGIITSENCTECYDGFYLGPNKNCSSPCPPNCKSCTSSTYCTECKTGFYNGYEYDNNKTRQLNNCTYTCSDTSTQCQSLNNNVQCKNESQKQKDASNTVPVAIVAILGSLFTAAFTVNVVILIVLLIRKLKVSRRYGTKTQSRTENEPTYENQLESTVVQFSLISDEKEPDYVQVF